MSLTDTFVGCWIDEPKGMQPAELDDCSVLRTRERRSQFEILSAPNLCVAIEIVVVPEVSLSGVSFDCSHKCERPWSKG